MQVRFHEEASSEFDEAIEYYENIYQGLGLDFFKEIKDLIEIISENPSRWAEHPDETRRVPALKFPYILVYSIIDDTIWILAVAHEKRFPEYWSDRIV